MSSLTHAHTRAHTHTHTHIQTRKHVCVCACVRLVRSLEQSCALYCMRHYVGVPYILECRCEKSYCISHTYILEHMEWLRLVGSLKL